MATVLVVDDNSANRDLVDTVLGYTGHRVVQASGGVDALAVARSRPLDLIITDLVMPGMDGYELVRELRADAELAAIPVIFYTAHYMQDEVNPVASTLGVRHRLTKPVEPRLLQRTVEEALEEPRRTPRRVDESFRTEHQRAIAAKLVSTVEELERAEVELHSSQAMFRALSESAPVGIFSLTASGDMTYANPCLLRICGLRTFRDVPSWGRLIHPDDRHRLARSMSRTLETGVGFRDTVSLVRPDGAVRHVVIRLSQVTEQADDARYVGTVEDVTDAVEAQQQRDELQKRLQMSERLESLGQLAAGISHDFNNLLAVIANSAELAAEAVRETMVAERSTGLDEVLEDITAISGAAARAADLTKRLLVFARRDVSKRDMVDVNEVVGGSLALLSRTIGAGIKLQHDFAPALPRVVADRGQLDQVVMNLVINARDATGQDGHILVTTAAVDHAVVDQLEPGDYVQITVTDNGSGMDPDTIAHAFEPFFTTKAVGYGTGLGLSTVYGIVTGMGGTITVDSEPGVGTSLSVYLPVAP